MLLASEEFEPKDGKKSDGFSAKRGNYYQMAMKYVIYSVDVKAPQFLVP